MFEIEVDTSALKKLDRALRGMKEKIPVAASISINRALNKGRTEVKREIRKEYVVKAKDIPVQVRGANAKSLGGAVMVKGPMLDLNKFVYRPKTIQRGKPSKRRPLYIQVKKAGGKIVPHAFVAHMPNDYEGPFERVETSRLPIRKLLGISPAIMASQPHVGPAVQKAMDAAMTKSVDQQIKRFLGK